ncbi:MAG: 4Fe-4S dicluster domain-containing protein [Gaiellales bacterium]|nr:MAG: 4Fe-4S dicluster domain-containing protein [Gaiellales bacterium]
MPHRISDECLVCGVCADECHSHAITGSDDAFAIDPDSCDDCGECAEVCPNDAIDGS